MATSSMSDKKYDLATLFGLLGVTTLAFRVALGFVFWGGFSRRAVYGLSPTGDLFKLNPESPNFVANKLSAAYPGSLISDILEWVLMNDALTYWFLIFFSIAELLVGVALIIGFATRLAAFGSLMLNGAMMLVFGWMGSTCLDEWTMAAFGFGMSLTIMLTGAGYFSVDSLLEKTKFGQSCKLFPWAFSGALPMDKDDIIKWSKIFGAASFVFAVGFYHIFYGAVFSKLGSRTSFHHQVIALSDVKVSEEGQVKFHAYVNAGPDTQAAYIIKVELLDSFGEPVATWDGQALADMGDSAFENQFKAAWGSQFYGLKYGFAGRTGAKAYVTLNAPEEGLEVQAGEEYTLKLSQIEGKPFELKGTAKAAEGGFELEASGEQSGH